MQRFLSLQVASNLPKKLSNTSTSSSLLHARRFIPFYSAIKPNNPAQNQLLCSFHPFHHQSHSRHIFSGKSIYGFFSKPAIAKQFLLDSTNNLLRASSKSVTDCGVRFVGAQFHRQSFRFNPSFDSRRRGW